MASPHVWWTVREDKTEKNKSTISTYTFEYTRRGGAQLCIRWYIDPYRWHGQFKVHQVDSYIKKVLAFSGDHNSEIMWLQCLVFPPRRHYVLVLLFWDLVGTYLADGQRSLAWLRHWLLEWSHHLIIDGVGHLWTLCWRNRRPLFRFSVLFISVLTATAATLKCNGWKWLNWELEKSPKTIL